jgi:hypothetical protein
MSHFDWQISQNLNKINKKSKLWTLIKIKKFVFCTPQNIEKFCTPQK